MMKLAMLGDNGLLLGYEDVAEAPNPMPPDRVDGGDGDLTPGRFRWNCQKLTFDPVPVSPDAQLTQDPNVVRILWKIGRALQRSGKVQFDAEVADWIAAFGKTVDAQEG